MASDFNSLLEQLEAEEKTKKEVEAKEVSNLEALARGAAQGASLGFADEATAGLLALKDAALTDQSLGEAYAKELAESRAAYKKAEEQAPIASTIGNVGGSIAGGIATAGAGTALGATKLGASLATRLPLLARLGAAAPELQEGMTAVEKAATVLPTAAKAISQGAVTGGVASLGEQEDKSLDKALSDAAKGGAFSGGLAALGRLGKIAVSESKYGADILKAAELGKKKETIVGRTAAEQSKEALSREREALARKSKEVFKPLLEERDAALDAAESAGKVIPYKKVRNDIVAGIGAVDEGDVPKKDARDKIIRALKQRVTKDAEGKEILTPKNLHELRQEINDLAFANPESLPAQRAGAIAVSGTLHDFIPETLPLDEKISAWSSIHNQFIGSSPYEQRAIKDVEKRVNLSPETLKLSSALAQPLEGGSPDVLKPLKALLSETAQGRENKDILEPLKSAAEKAYLTGTLSRSEGLGEIQRYIGTVPSITAKAANVAAHGKAVASEAATALYNKDPMYLKTLADKIGSTAVPGTDGAKLAQILTEASASGKMRRNSLLFAIQQNPIYRSMLNTGTSEEAPVEQPSEGTDEPGQ